MKALTLTQPWATLVAIGAKRIETRSWATNYRGRLAIHAGKGPGSLGWMQMQHMCRYVEPFKSILDLNDQHPGKVLPFGAIVATCELLGCEQIGYEWPDNQLIAYTGKWGRAHKGHRLTAQERAFGDYTLDRWVWLLADIKPLATPIPAKGALSLWEWEESAD